MKNNRKRKLDILLSTDVSDEKVKNVKRDLPEPMSIEETKSESESEDEVESDEEAVEESEENPEEVEESEERPDSEPEVIEFIDPIQLLKKKRAEQLAKRAKMTEITDPRTGKRKLVEMESISKKQIRQELERVKFSVQQFGLQAYNPTERRKLERDRLIRLGAKAPKKEWKNYKELMSEKRHEAEKRAEAEAEERDSFLSSKSLTKSKGKSGGKTGFWTDGTKNTNRQSIGAWKGGQLTISKSKIKALSGPVKKPKR